MTGFMWWNMSKKRKKISKPSLVDVWKSMRKDPIPPTKVVPQRKKRELDDDWEQEWMDWDQT